MSTKIKITKNIGGHQAGDTITVTNKTADVLREAGVVEEKPARVASKKADETTSDGGEE
jgi:hypothetical protein